jgi:hypothetical protein
MIATASYISKFLPKGKKVGMAKSHLKYIIERVDQHGKKIERDLFDWSGETTERRLAEKMIEQATSMHIFRFMLSPDVFKEDTFKDLNMRRLLQETMGELRILLKEDFRYVGVIHNDHGRPINGLPRRHIHSMAFIHAFIKPDIIQEKIRLIAQEKALLQRRELDRRQEKGIITQLFHKQPAKQILQFKEPIIVVPKLEYCGACENGYNLIEGQKCQLCGRSRENNVELTL